MKIIIVGKSGSGKDFLRNKFEDRGFRFNLVWTTRPQREGEKSGKDYVFVNKETFSDFISKQLLYSFTEFNGWFYGIIKSSWENDNLFIMSPAAVKQIKPEDRKNCFIIYLDIPIEVRQERLGKRMMPGDSAERRLVSDEADFLDFTDYDIRITNPNF